MDCVNNYTLSILGLPPDALTKTKSVYTSLYSPSCVIEPCALLEKDGRIIMRVDEKLKDEAARILNGATGILPYHVGKLYELCSDYAQSKGYKIDKSCHIVRRYIVEKPVELSGSHTPVQLTGSEKDILLSDIPFLVSRGPVFGIIESGNVVSLCGAVLKQGFAEAYVETAPKYRRKGYAVSSLLALSRYLNKSGIPLVYELREENEASKSTVKRAGGILHSRYVRFIARE
ncbi:MAG: GNAT family N-acetyltransferase [Bacillota bacterium]|nr:GNAT family N-acetyltransferase [Bacillota bacterium]